MTPEQFDALGVLLGSHTISPVNQALRLVLVDGLTQLEAASRMGVTHQAVGQKLARAREVYAAAQVLATAEMPAHRKGRRPAAGPRS